MSIHYCLMHRQKRLLPGWMHSVGFWLGYSLGVAAAILYNLSAFISNVVWVFAILLLAWQLRAAIVRHRHDFSKAADLHLAITVLFFLSFFALQMVLNLFF